MSPCRLEEWKEGILSERQNSISYYAMEGDLREVQRRIAKGEDINKVEGEGELDATCLMLASSHGHLFVVTALLKAGADHTYADKEGHTALFLACYAGHESVVSALIEAGTDKEVTCGVSGSPWTPLSIACAENHPRVVKVLLQAGTYVEGCPSERSYSPLVFACAHGNEEVVEVLLEYGCIVDRHVGGDTGFTALTMACWKKQLGIVQRLVKAGASFSFSERSNGDSPLVRAVRAGSDEVVAYLLSAGAEIDSPLTHGGESALMVAAEKNHIKIARRLLMAGANINHRANDNCTALYNAAEKSSAEMTELLLSAGASIDVPGCRIRTPLMWAIVNDNIEAAGVLISAGANVNFKGHKDVCSLFVAKSSRAVDLLIHNGAKVDSVDELGSSALHHAVITEKNNGVLISLLRGGCNPEATNILGDTAVESGEGSSAAANLERFVAIFKAGGVSALASCDACGEYPAKACSGCKQVYYCGVKCQRECWRGHKVACKAVSNAQKT